MTVSRRTTAGLVVAALLPLALLAAPRATARESVAVRTDDATLAAVVEYVDEQRSRLGVPGVALAIVVGDDVRVAAGSGNDSAGRPVTEDTVFLINSLSKSVTATALLQLVDAGLVDLDAPLDAYVEELSPEGGTVTVRDVMHHRSGVPGELYPRPEQHDLEALAEADPGLRPHLQAGADHRYTNLNYDLLALVVERVSGETFADYVTAHVFEPLGMEHSAVGTDRAQELAPTGGHYKWLVLGHRPWQLDVDHGQVGSAAMYSSAGDMAGYLVAHMNEGVFEGTELLSADAVATLHEGRPIDATHDYAGGLVVTPATSSSESHMALDRHLTVGHDGNSETFRSTMWMTLGPDVGMVLLANGNDVVDGSWMNQLSHGARLLLSGEEPGDVVTSVDFLTRWSKHIFLALALVQLVLLLSTIPVLRHLRRGRRPANRHWTLLAAASLLDVVAAVLVFVVTPAVADVPLRVVMEFPDYRILLAGIIGLVGWGVVRTVLAGWWSGRTARRADADEPSPV